MRNYLIQSTGDLKRKVICVLDQVFPEYQTIFSNTFETTSKQLLLDFSSPSDFEELSVETLTETLEKLSRKKVSQSTAEKLINSAKNSFGITFSKESFTFQLKLLIEQIKFIDNQVKECETKIKELMVKINSPITTIPGIGLVLGAVARKMCNIIYAVLKNNTPYEVPKQ